MVSCSVLSCNILLMLITFITRTNATPEYRYNFWNDHPPITLTCVIFILFQPYSLIDSLLSAFLLTLTETLGRWGKSRWKGFPNSIAEHPGPDHARNTLFLSHISPTLCRGRNMTGARRQTDNNFSRVLDSEWNIIGFSDPAIAVVCGFHGVLATFWQWGDEHQRTTQSFLRVPTWRTSGSMQL